MENLKYPSKLENLNEPNYRSSEIILQMFNIHGYDRIYLPLSTNLN